MIVGFSERGLERLILQAHEKKGQTNEGVVERTGKTGHPVTFELTVLTSE